MKSTIKEQMTVRERVLAALKLQPVDRIPFVPLIDTYTLMEMPVEVTGKPVTPAFNLQMNMTAARALGCDLMVRHVPAVATRRDGALHLQSLGQFESPVETSSKFNNRQLTEILNTPVGSLTASWKFTDKVGGIPHPVKFAVNNREEMKIFHYAVDRLSSKPSESAFERFLKIDAEIGEQGIPTASITKSPFMFLIEIAWGLENTYFLLQGHREEVEDILEKLHNSLKLHVEVLAASPAQVIIQYEDTSSTLLSP
ncbi:MAG: hypothetical protein JRF41_09350, partial [Deltaproteobacteria bacterium]|nr:hypothetical protein [Deltaproteobacteria bacterium]